MENRRNKRTEPADEMPADKRTCTSLEFRASSSHSTPETHENDMDTSSSVSASSRSEGEPEKDYGSCDSDDPDPRQNSLHEYYRRRLSGDQDKLKNILRSLSEETDPSEQLVALTQLCEVLSFCTEDSLSSVMADSLSPVLVKLAGHESNLDIMLLSIRAMTYLCDVFPRSSTLLIRHDAVTSLCQRLMAIEYLDVAEQCLQALEKISKDHPLHCLQAGAIMAVLSYIDFFSTSIQRVALSTVVNICKKLPSDGHPPFMEAVPTLCNLLQYEDRQLVESASICLVKIVERVSLSSEMLDELCKHGLINGVIHLLNSNSRTTLSQPTYSGLIGLLLKLSSGSVGAFKTLYELDISSLLKDILSNYDLSHTMTPSHIVNGQCNQVHEVLKLLNELLPASSGDKCSMTVSDKAYFLDSRPDLLQKFGLDILPLLVQVVYSGANMYVSYGCLYIVKKLVNLSKPGVLVELLKSANIPSFLAGVFTRKDHHVITLALEITEMTLQKASDIVSNSFIKEGVYFAIDALLTPEKCSQSMFPVLSSVLNDSSQKLSTKELVLCLCVTFDASPSPSTSETGSGICRLEKDSVHDIAKRIKTTYFSSELFDSGRGLTDVLQKLKCLSTALNDLRSTGINSDASVQHEEKLYGILHQIMDKLNGREPVSIFEFIESGLARSLVNYLTDGVYLWNDVELRGEHSQFSLVEKRFEVFSRLFSPASDLLAEDLPLLPFIRMLQSALSSLEDFPVISSQVSKQRSYATVPRGRSTVHSCLKVSFVRGDGETDIGDYSEEIVNVDPLASLDAIEGFLRPKVRPKRTNPTNSCSESESEDHMMSQDSQLARSANSSQDESLGPVDPASVASALTEMQEINLSKSVPDQVDLGQPNSVEAASSDETNVVSRSFLRAVAQISLGFCHMNSNELVRPADQKHSLGVQPRSKGSAKPSEAVTNMKTQCSASDSDENASSKLLLFLVGEQLDYSLTLYQAILQQRIKADDEVIAGRNIWSQVYTLTYRRGVETAPNMDSPAQDLFVSDIFGAPLQHASFLRRMFTCDLISGVDKSNPTHDILFLLKSMEMINRSTFHLISCERIRGFGEGRIHDLDDLRVEAYTLPQSEFVSSKLTEKLEQQMRDSLAVSSGGMPSWCSHLMSSYPFLFSFEVRCKYFRQEAFGPTQLQQHPASQNTDTSTERRQSGNGLARRKFLVRRERILESAAQMMDKYAGHKFLLEVEYNEEVGTGLGPTLEFYTLVSHEFQKYGMGMWREDYRLFSPVKNSHDDDFGMLISTSGLFPRPWPSSCSTENIQFSEVHNKFVLLGKVVAKALQDGRVLDLPFSKAFYKLILGQELSLYDIPSFDPEFGRTLIEFQALVNRGKHLDSLSVENSRVTLGACFRDTKIEELCLDFALPGYPDCNLTTDQIMVNKSNLGDYVSLVVDATIHSGISRQVEAFKSGFNKVFPIRHLQVFTEEELERLLCGERDVWAFNELLDHIKFDHGYTASSPPIINLLEIVLEFNYEQRRAFLQFVTGAPRLPPGGLASLNPKLTIVRKHCSGCVDADLPSVMTCANYLKLPPYSSKERMKEKLLYAITEGQGSFHLS